MMNRSTAAGCLIVFLLVGLLIGGLALSTMSGQHEREQIRQQQVTLRQLDVAEAEADARITEAQVQPEIIRETFQGWTEHMLASAYASELTSNGDALRYLATYDQRSRDNWRSFFQMALLCYVTAAGITTIVLWRRQLFNTLGTPANDPPDMIVQRHCEPEPAFDGQYRDDTQ